MTRDELDALWQQALHESVVAGEDFITQVLVPRYHFAELVAAAERDKHDTGTHTCSNRCQRYACVAVREAVLAEREACAKLLDDNWFKTQSECAAAIRAKGQA